MENFKSLLFYFGMLSIQGTYRGSTLLGIPNLTARELERQSTIREFIEGEAHVKGFLLAYLGLTRGYTILPEYEASKGYADFYMMPDLIHQLDIAYSYIVEVKYARRDATDAEIETLKSAAYDQLRRYAADEAVQRSKGGTQLRLIRLVFKGWKLLAAEELALT